MLRQRFQIWHVVYQTEAPLLVTRLRIAQSLDKAWQLLDPEGNDPARSGIVLVGHSLGGVASRLLCADSERVLWDISFTVAPDVLPGDPKDADQVRSTFLFKAYPGVSQAIFMAAPHRGAPKADEFVGRLMRSLVGRRAPEMKALQTLATDHPEVIVPMLRQRYQQGRLNSIITLQPEQPIRRAGETLMPVAGISYHVISGVLPGSSPPSDGAVPLSSTLLPGASSTLQVKSGHEVYKNPEAIAEVLRILKGELPR